MSCTLRLFFLEFNSFSIFNFVFKFSQFFIFVLSIDFIIDFFIIDFFIIIVMNSVAAEMRFEHVEQPDSIQSSG
jgi:hypothetical protein